MHRANRWIVRPCSLALTLAAAAGQARAEVVQFHRSVGLPTSEIAYGMAATSDRGFITVGRTAPATTAPPDIHVVRYDALGNDLWTRIISSVNQRSEIAYAVIQTSDGGFIIGAETDSVSARLGIALIRLDAAGALVWSRVYAGTPFLDSPAGVALAELDDGSIVVVGRHLIGPAGSPTTGLLLHATAAGIPIFLNHYQDLGSTVNEGSLSFSDVVVVDNGVIIGGWLTDSIGGPTQPLLVTMDFSGTPAWANTYVVSGMDTSADALQLTGDSVVYGGRLGIVGSAAARVDLTGAPIWSRTIAGFWPGFSAAARDADESILFAGRAQNPTNGALLKLGLDGGFLGGVRYGTTDSRTEDHDIAVLPCGFGYAIAGGTTMTPTNGLEDVHFARTNRDGRTGCREAIFTPGITTTTPHVVPRTLIANPEVQHQTWPVAIANPISGNIRYCADIGCPADLNGDGLVDFADYLEFLNLFDAGSRCVDFNGDGLVDFADYLEFLNHFDAGC